MGYGVADTGVDFDFLTPQQAHALLKSDGAVFVDSRDPDDFKASHIQTSYCFPANDIIFKKDKLDKSLVQRCKDLATAGKLIVAVSDAGISGLMNRGHVSRCRHVAQYFNELGVDQGSIRRISGGLNAWKASGLDGILGDTRMYYAGAVVSPEHARALSAAEQLADVDEVSEPEEGAKDAVGLQEGLETTAVARWPEETLPDRALVPSAPAPVSAVPSSLQPDPASTFVTSPTVYRVLNGEVFKKASTESEKIIKLSWPMDRLVRTTGQIFVGASGGRWAELDEKAGEKKGWVYVEGPGFGPSTRKIVTEFLRA